MNYVGTPGRTLHGEMRFTLGNTCAGISLVFQRCRSNSLTDIIGILLLCLSFLSNTFDFTSLNVFSN